MAKAIRRHAPLFPKLKIERELLAMKRTLHRPLWGLIRECWDLQEVGKRLALTENPHTSAALLLPEMEMRPGLCEATIAQCMFGLEFDLTHLKVRENK